jgi:hypothetical protein
MDGLETNGNAIDVESRDPAAGARLEPVSPSVSSPDLMPPTASSSDLPALKAAPAAPLAAATGFGADKTPVQQPKVFVADLPHGADSLGFEKWLRPLAELAVHRDTETPLTIGLLGGPGSGKSFALARLMAMIRALGAASGGSAAFLDTIFTVTIDGSALAEAPAVSLAAALYENLAKAFPDLAQEAAHAVRDPHLVAREAAERLDSTRRRLDSERQVLAEIESRRARLTESLLFEQPGSQVDAYVRANRTKFESRLEGFGITGDAIQNSKSMIRDIAEPGGATARIGAALHALWAFRGQTRLLVTAAVLLLLAFGCDLATIHQIAWLAWLRGLGSNEAFVPMANWLEAHIGWLDVGKQAVLAGAAFAVLINLFRATRFLRPLFRGVDLLKTEVAQRRRDLDSVYAHQMHRVDALAADAEQSQRHAAEAGRRATNGGAAGVAGHGLASPFEAVPQKFEAERFFAALAAAVQNTAGGAAAIARPRRLVIGLDNVDRLPQSKAHELIDAVSRRFAHPAFVTVIAADPQRLVGTAESGAANSNVALLEKWIQIPLRIGGALNGGDYAVLVAQALGYSENPPGSGRADAQPLDWAVTVAETQFLTELAPLASASPRAVKRFVNLYRIARAQAPDDLALLAFMLALDQGGDAGDRAAVDAVLAQHEAEAEFALQHGSAQLQAALAHLRAGEGGERRVTIAAARRVWAIAQAYSFRI